MSAEGMCQDVTAWLQRLMEIRMRYPSDPVFRTDHSQLRTTCVDWVEDCLSHSTVQDIRTVLNVTDFLFNDTFDMYWRSAEDVSQ
jgi:hypothetical protein